MSRYQEIKQKTYNILSINADDNADKKFIHVIDDYFISGLILLNLVAIILESYEPLALEFDTFFKVFDIFTGVVFTIEYLIRIWIAELKFSNLPKWKARCKYIFSPIGLTDLIAILPFFLPFFINLEHRNLKIVQLVRLVRLFKLAHYSSSLIMVLNVLRSKKDELMTTIFASFIMIMLSASIMYHIEHEIQPDKFPNIFASFWWAVATLTTIGYGDVFPVTGWGQFLAAITALFGIGLVAIPTGIISMGFMEEIQKKKEKKAVLNIDDSDKQYNYKYCPHCGEKLPDEMK